MIAVLARPKGEDYDEGNTLIRGEEFKKLDLNAAMNVSFFLMRLNVLSKKDSVFYTLLHQLGQSKQELKGWGKSMDGI